jgi:hypothetical protein
MSNMTRLRSLGLALAAGTAILALQPAPAMAQFWGYGSWYGGPGASWAPAPAYPRAYDEDRLRPAEIADLLRGYGWAILGPPTRSGQNYVANVRDSYGRHLFVVLDAYDGRLLTTRLVDDRPDTNKLAAIPGASTPQGQPEERVRPILPDAGAATPAPRKPRPQAKRIQAPASVKTAPLAPPEGTVAVAKPTATQPTPKHPMPATAKGTPEPADAPVVRQVYPDSGAPPAPAPATPPSPAPAQAAASTPAPAEATPAPAMPAPVTPAPAAPAKPAKAALPPDAGYE